MFRIVPGLAWSNNGAESQGMWAADTEALPSESTLKVTIRRDGETLRFADALEFWQREQAFRAFLIALLAESPFAAYFWECPPVTDATATRSFEFVLVDSPPLAQLPPDPQAFAGHFRPGEATATFWNLGRDAVLVAPSPAAPVAVYPHLAAFSRSAPIAQQHALWRAVGTALARRIGPAPVWLSTSGLGVAWLHVRLDSRPKYYSYHPYRRSRSAL
jgi:hypothetical protein